MNTARSKTHCTINTMCSRGFTLIELMIVIAVISIILSIALPTYFTYQVRAKVGEALSVGMGAKTSLSDTCQSDMALTNLTNSRAGFIYDPSLWVSSIVISGDCSEPLITITTQNTGASTDPVITLTGSFTLASGRIVWVCSNTSSSNNVVPAECRS